MKKNYYASIQKDLSGVAENSKQPIQGGIKIFSMHIPMEIYLVAKEMAEFRNISMKQYVLEGLCRVVEEDMKRGTI